MTLLLRFALCAYMLALGWVVFAPAKDAGQVTGIVSVLASWAAQQGWAPVDQMYLFAEFFANVVLFIPFGVLWMLVAPRPHPVAVIGTGLATSVLIEVVQLALPSRVSSLSDVIANTLGAAVGVAIVVLVRSAASRNATPDEQRV